jgi:hypothetical protein
MFPKGNGLKQGDALSPLLFNFALEMLLGWPSNPGWLKIKLYESAFGLC